MSIDYQQILMDMNGPRYYRARKSSFSRYLIVFLLLFLAGASAWVWWSGYAGTGYEYIRSHVSALLNGRQSETEPVADSAFTLPVDRTSVTQQPIVETAGTTAVRVEPARTSPVQSVPAPDARARQSAPTPPELAEAKAWASPGAKAREAEPTPPVAQSPLRMELKAIDQLLTTNPAEAMTRLQRLAGQQNAPDDQAEITYRLGYAARMLKDEAKSEEFWTKAVDSWPNTRGGRYSALALGDTWNKQFAGDKPQPARWDDIHRMYSIVLGRDDAPFLAPAMRAAVKVRQTKLSEKVIFGSAPSKLAKYHQVESGELLGSIAGKYRMDYESVARINGIDPNRIRAGMDLKVITGEVEIIVRKNTANKELGPTLTWYIDNRWIKELPACVGDGNKTPAGSYVITSKERDPSWTNPANGQLLPNNHPENILGSRWMAMKGMNTQGLGIHGTTVPDSIPGYTSAGCVRMLNPDVEELFSFARIGGKVTIVD